MGGIVHAIQSYLEQYGYPILFVTVFVESFGIPAPGQTLLITAAIFAATGKLVLWGVLVTAFAAAVIGDSLGYLMGLKGGRRLLIRYGGRFGIHRRRLSRLTRRFNRHGGWFVAFARFFDVLRQVNGLLAGSVEMPFHRFLFFNAAGAALWVSLWGIGAYYLGRGLRDWLHTFDFVATWLVIGVLALALVLVGWWLVRRHRRNREPPAASAR